MSFETFIHRFNGTDREFGDGYSCWDFEDMSEDDRALARAMLLERGLSGNGIDISGLRHVGDAGTVAALDAAGTRSEDPTFDIVRLETLFALSGESRYLEAMICWIDAGSVKVRSFAAEVFSRQRISRDFIAAILVRLEDGKHEDLVTPLTSAWLAAHGEPAGADVAVFTRHLSLIRAVCAARPRHRRALLAQVCLPG